MGAVLNRVLPRLPTLCLVLVLAMLACWALAGLTFAFDRFRVPLLSVLVAYGWLISHVSWDDNFFQSVRRKDRNIMSLPAEAILGHRSNRPAIVIAAAGEAGRGGLWRS
jgi:hypothetical protein